MKGKLCIHGCGWEHTILYFWCDSLREAPRERIRVLQNSHLYQMKALYKYNKDLKIFWMCSQKFLCYGQKAFSVICGPINHKMSDISKNYFSILTNEVLNESLWYQLPISCKKIEEKNWKIQNLAKNGFCRDEIYVKIFTECVISWEILDGF